MPPDWHMSVWVTDLAGGCSAGDEFMRVIASNYFAPKLAAIMLLFMWFGTRQSVRRERNQRAILISVVGMALGFLVAELLELIQGHWGEFWARPYENHIEASQAMELLYFKLPDPSFPSNAMCGFVPIALIIWLADRRFGSVLSMLAVCWGFGRVYVGIHYPVDIIGGILIGLIAALIAIALARILDREVSWVLSGARRLYLA